MEKEDEKLKKIQEELNEAYYLGLIHRILHEIGHPLSSIRMHISNITNDRISSPLEIKSKLMAIDKMAELMEMELRNLGFLINESRSIEILDEPKEVYLDNLIRKITSGLQFRAKSKGLSIQLKGSVYQPIKVNPSILSQIIWNILDNAIKYSLPSKGDSRDSTIFIEYETLSDFIKITVTNFGLTIIDEDQERIFGKHYRGKEASMISPTGSGLGLFVSKMCAYRINGELSVLSDKGLTSFILKFRRAQ